MKYSEMTISNSIPEVNNRYCQLLLEGMYFPYLETKGSPNVAWAKWIQDISNESIAVYQIEDTKTNFEIVERVFKGFCNYLPQTSEEHGWTFDNLIAILGKGETPGGYPRFDINLLKNTANLIFMYYLNTSKFRSYEKYSNTDVNLYKDVLMKAMSMADLSTGANSISWLGGEARKPWSFHYYDSTSERIQQVLEKPWKDIQQTYLKILSDLRDMSAIHLENLSEIPSSVLFFCYQQQILRHLPTAVDIIEKSFLTTINKIDMEPEIDPETGEEWLELKIKIKGEVEEVLDEYDKYTDLLVSSIPSSARYHMRLSYNIA